MKNYCIVESNSALGYTIIYGGGETPNQAIANSFGHLLFRGEALPKVSTKKSKRGYWVREIVGEEIIKIKKIRPEIFTNKTMNKLKALLTS